MVHGVNGPRVCVAGYLVEYPLLILAIVDIDPLFVVPNKLSGILMIAKVNLVGAGIRMEPSQVESLEIRPTSSQVQSEEWKDLQFSDR